LIDGGLTGWCQFGFVLSQASNYSTASGLDLRAQLLDIALAGGQALSGWTTAFGGRDTFLLSGCDPLLSGRGLILSNRRTGETGGHTDQGNGQ